MTTQLGLRLDGWHERRLKELSKEAELPHNTVARHLLKVAIEQTSLEPPDRLGTAFLDTYFRS